MSSPWQTTGSRTVYENGWVRVREDDVVRPDGSTGIYGVTQLVRPAVFVVPVTDVGEVVLVRLFRYPIDRWSWEVPAGGAEVGGELGGTSEDLVDGARRELLEEAGLSASSWTAIGEVFSLNGLADAPGRVFLAQGLSDVPGSEADQREEGICEVRRFPWSELPALAGRGDLTDGETLAALQLARWHLGS